MSVLVVVYSLSIRVFYGGDGRQNLSDEISSSANALISTIFYPIEIFISPRICVGSARQRHLPRIPSLYSAVLAHILNMSAYSYQTVLHERNKLYGS